jgi:1,4-alpha-glucan branching enzyme
VTAGISRRLSDQDLEPFVRGDEIRLWERLGAHLAREAGSDGVRFAVWAPHATGVSVVGGFNDWDGARHPMRSCGKSGVWEVFVPAVRAGALYKYEIRTRLGGRRSVKADPLGFAMELRPRTASVVWDLSAFEWTDDEWMASRRERQRLDRPISIYEVHLGSWRRGEEVVPSPDGEGEQRRLLDYDEIAEQLVPYACDMGYTHLELLPIMEHPFDGSWGYQSVGYFAPTSRFGPPDGLARLVDSAHRAGLGVILDWVPGHFPRDAHGLGFFDGTHLYEYGDPQRGLHRDWGTFVFDWGKPQVASFLISNALFWLHRYHADGLRVDAVAAMLYLDYGRKPGEWAPNEHGGRENLDAVSFLQRLNETVHRECPDALVCAEESTAWPQVTGSVSRGGLGFDLKWNMGWMNDMLRYSRLDPLLRKRHQDKLTFSLTYAFEEKFLLPLSHDEVVHQKASLLSKMPGEVEQPFANLRALYGYMFAHPGKKLLFMGGEIGQRKEWNHDAELDWSLLEQAPHEGLRAWVKALNRLYASRRALHEVEDGWGGFEWLDFEDAARSVVAFARRGRDPREFLVFVANFTPIAWKDYRLGVPEAREYCVSLSSDDPEFGGGGTGVSPLLAVEAAPANGRDHSIVLTLPPMSVLYLEPSPPSIG